jgi:hypothetical protein
MQPAPSIIDYDNFSYGFGADVNALKGGSCWKKIFAERTSKRSRIWIGLYEMRELSKTFKVSEGKFFTVEMVAPGIIRIEETEDETEWCFEDFLRLPRWYRIG